MCNTGTLYTAYRGFYLFYLISNHEVLNKQALIFSDYSVYRQSTHNILFHNNLGGRPGRYYDLYFIDEEDEPGNYEGSAQGHTD